MFDKILQFPTRRPKTVTAVILGITALAVAILVRPGLKLDPNPWPLDPGHPSMVAYSQLKQDFTGTLETALIHLRHPDTVFNAATLRRVREVTAAIEDIQLTGPSDEAALAAHLPGLEGEPRGLLEAVLAEGLGEGSADGLYEVLDALELEGVSAPALEETIDVTLLKLQPIREVTSLANVENIVAEGDRLIVDKIYGNESLTAVELGRIQAAVESNAIFDQILISSDRRSTGIQVETNIPETQAVIMYGLYQRILAILEEFPGAEQAHVAGFPVVAASADNIMQEDNKTFFPLVMGLVVLVLFLTFRMVGGIGMPISVVVISVLWTLAIMTVAGIPMNLLTTTVPVFLITIGVADGIHLFSEFKDHLRGGHSRQASAAAMLRRLALPVAMTSVTTAIGFLTLAVTEVKMIREFGIFVAVGVMVAMAVSLTLIPAVLSLGRNRKAAPSLETPERAGFRSIFRRLDRLVLDGLVWGARAAARYHRWVLAGAAVVVAVGIYGTTQVEVKNDFISY
ncbi:MAG: MMPL family transporter, partial [bacterium]